jgi:hypothetical protein
MSQTKQTAKIENLTPDETDMLRYFTGQVEAAQATMNSFAGYIMRKYNLSAQDQITPDGKIVRVGKLEHMQNGASDQG